MNKIKKNKSVLKKILIGVFSTLIILLVLLISAFLFMASPRTTKKGKLSKFYETPIAHRGLYDNNTAVVENSLAAFDTACTHGFIIELDVQLTKDNELIVFHDYDLYRACNTFYPGIKSIKEKTPIYELSYDKEIKNYNIFGSMEKIPRLTDVLTLINNRVPVLIEIKVEKKELVNLTAKITNNIMSKFPNTVMAVQSFNPKALEWFKTNNPDVLRGQLVRNFVSSKEGPKNARFLLTNMLGNFLSRPDFYVHKFDEKGGFGYKLTKKIFKVPVFVWTIKNQKDYDENIKKYANIIFDGFIPAK